MNHQLWSTMFDSNSSSINPWELKAFDLAVIYIPIYVYTKLYDSYGMKSNAHPENFWYFLPRKCLYIMQGKYESKENFSDFEPKVDALSEKQNSVEDPNIVNSFIGKFSS